MVGLVVTVIDGESTWGHDFDDVESMLHGAHHSDDVEIRMLPLTHYYAGLDLRANSHRARRASVRISAGLVRKATDKSLPNEDRNEATRLLSVIKVLLYGPVPHTIDL